MQNYVQRGIPSRAAPYALPAARLPGGDIFGVSVNNQNLGDFRSWWSRACSTLPRTRHVHSGDKLLGQPPVGYVHPVTAAGAANKEIGLRGAGPGQRDAGIGRQQRRRERARAVEPSWPHAVGSADLDPSMLQKAVRVQRVQMVEEMAGKTSVKLVFPLVLFIFPALFLVTLGPAAIMMADSFKSLSH